MVILRTLDALLINPNLDENFVSDVIQADSDDVNTWNLAPQTDWHGISGSEHFVQFYEADWFLLSSWRSGLGPRNRKAFG